jgi:uncharacterized RDD family membrane protein YckC
MADCPRCGATVAADTKFCGVCGARLGERSPGGGSCPTCGAYVAPGVKFCLNCGGPLGGPNYAGFWQRFGALFLDSIIYTVIGLVPAVIAGFIAYALAGPADETELAPGETDPAETIGIFTGYVVYFLVAVAYQWIGNAFGGTFGKRAFGILVVSADDGEQIGLGRAFLRFLVYIVGYSALYLGLLWMLWDDKKQTWHDKAANSIVIKKR